VLFGAPNRADLAACVPAWPLRALRVRVHRNHGFEAVSSATRAYAAWNGLDFEWLIGGYDDSLSFDVASDADIEIVWLDTTRLQGLAEVGIVDWLIGRLRTLRSQTVRPILVLAWPLSDSDRTRLDEAMIPDTHVAAVSTLAAALGERWIDARAAALSGTRLGNHACLMIARELACFDLPIASLSRVLFEEHRFAYLKLLGEALANAELDVDRRFVWTAVTQDMLTRHDVTLDEVEGLIDIVRRTTEAEVTCVLKEEPDGSVRVSLRSLGDVDVRAIAADNGGGGHRHAAGFESTLGIPSVVANIRGAL